MVAAEVTEWQAHSRRDKAASQARCRSFELPIYPPERRPNSCGATNGRLRTFPPTRSPSASATNEPEDQQQDQRTNGGVDDGRNNSQAKMDAELRKQPTMRLSRDLLMRGITYKLQERSLGGLSKSMASDVQKPPPISLKTGTRLVREWRGVTHTVLVHADGFEWNGRRHRSLT